MIIAPYKAGTDPRQMRATGGRLDERYIVPIARELAAGLKAIHDAGIIHRDVKCKSMNRILCD